MVIRKHFHTAKDTSIVEGNASTWLITGKHARNSAIVDHLICCLDGDASLFTLKYWIYMYLHDSLCLLTEIRSMNHLSSEMLSKGFVRRIFRANFIFM